MDKVVIVCTHSNAGHSMEAQKLLDTNGESDWLRAWRFFSENSSGGASYN